MATELFNTTLFSDPLLVSYYRAENANDSKGSNTLTNNGSVPFNPAKFNNGFDLGATNTTKWLSRTDDLGIHGDYDLSVSFWVKLQTEITSGTYRMVEHGSTNGADRYLQLDYQFNSGTLQLFGSASNGSNITYAVTLGTSVFHNMILTRNVSGNAIKLYFDGALVGSGTIGTGAAGSSIVGIGANASGAFGKSSAILDDMAWFNRVLTQADVDLINNGPAGATLSSASFLTNFV